MAISADIQTLPGLVAAADLSAKQYYWMEMASTAGQCKTLNATTDEAIGILQNDPTSGQEAEVAYAGVAKVIAGTSVGWAEAVRVGWDANGKAVPLAVNGTNNDRRFGAKFYSLGGQTTTVTLNQIISVVLYPGALQL